MASCWDWEGWTKKKPRAKASHVGQALLERGWRKDACPFCFGFSFKHHLLRCLNIYIYIIYRYIYIPVTQMSFVFAGHFENTSLSSNNCLLVKRSCF